MPSTLAQPLTQSQIDAASRFWAAGGWESKELVQLKQAFPERHDAIRIKAIVLNTLYGTRVIAIYKVAGLLEILLEKTHTTGPLLVEELVDGIKKVTRRAHYSFVAKFGHFFVDSNLPILDSYAEEMTAWHLGQAQSRKPERYIRFCENIETLSKLASLTCDCAELDAYLWVAGQYRAWLKNSKHKISSDLRPFFERLQKDPESEPDLRDLLGPIRAYDPLEAAVSRHELEAAFASAPVCWTYSTSAEPRYVYFSVDYKSKTKATLQFPFARVAGMLSQTETMSGYTYWKLAGREGS